VHVAQIPSVLKAGRASLCGVTTLALGNGLEIQLQGELYDWQGMVRIVSAELSNRRTGQRRIRVCKIRVVEEIKGRSANLEDARREPHT
jgi:hypothetical protein